MSTLDFSLPYMVMYSQSPNPTECSPISEKVAVVGLVVLLHLSAFLACWAQPEIPTILVNEMSISFTNAQMKQEDVVIKPKPKPKEVEPVSADEPMVKEETPPEPLDASLSTPALPDVSPPSPVVLDAEPDYRAEYLHNPRPPYPMVARRMGYHGKVVLNVEVLAEGRVGQVLLHQSSGYEILDNAAMQTVKGWRFSPARRFGQPVTLWFLVPIKFALEDNAA